MVFTPENRTVDRKSISSKSLTAFHLSRNSLPFLKYAHSFFSNSAPLTHHPSWTSFFGSERQQAKDSHGPDVGPYLFSGLYSRNRERMRFRLRRGTYRKTNMPNNRRPNMECVCRAPLPGWCRSSKDRNVLCRFQRMRSVRATSGTAAESSISCGSLYSIETASFHPS